MLRQVLCRHWCGIEKSVSNLAKNIWGMAYSKNKMHIHPSWFLEISSQNQFYWVYDVTFTSNLRMFQVLHNSLYGVPFIRAGSPD